MSAAADFERVDSEGGGAVLRFTGNLSLAALGDLPDRLDAVDGRVSKIDLSGIDRIDLAAIDAKSATAADDAFSFIGAGAFSGQAGQLRVEGGGGVWQVYGDTNGDSVADFQITVYGSAPVQTDFVF